MSEEVACGFIGFIIACVIMWFIWGFGSWGQDNSWRDQIVEHGCAEYYLDQNHARQWRWKDRP